MHQPSPEAASHSRIGALIMGSAAIGAAIAGALVFLSKPPQEPAVGATFPESPRQAPAEDIDGLTESDGVLPDGTAPFDDRYPGVTALDPDLLRALRDAAEDADADGIEFTVTSGWRSPDYQDQLLREAIAEYGSAEEAAEWVATAETSPHVSGDAVDIGPSSATDWLSEHGAAYGLCQIYRNEPWHYELRADAVDEGCPRPYPNPTYDPRMSR